MMKRRALLSGLGAATAWPVAARAQQDGRVRRVGVLTGNAEDDPEGQARIQSFRHALADLGWVADRNVHIDVRWAGADIARQERHARDLVAQAPEVILTTHTTATQVLQATTRTVPIVFVTLADPVVNGIVSNLARPEGNVTGFTIFEYSMAGKWLSLLKDIAPGLTRVALLFNPDTGPYAVDYVRVAQGAGERLALQVTGAGVRDAASIEPAIAAMGSGSNEGGLIVLPEPFNASNRTRMIALAAKYRVPAIYYDRILVMEGGLMSYGTNVRRGYRDGALYVDRILRGAKVGDLPVQFPTKFELVINLKTAKALGLDVSQQLQFLADEVIE
jgi:putative ABC transport system substrate-binding protein